MKVNIFFLNALKSHSGRQINRCPAPFSLYTAKLQILNVLAIQNVELFVVPIKHVKLKPNQSIVQLQYIKS